MSAVLTLRPTDCLRGGGDGVHAPTYTYRRLPKQEQRAAAAADTAHPPRASKLARPPGRDGRANGRQQRGRGSSHSHRAGAPQQLQSQSQMRAMESVVILKRGDQFAPEISAAMTVEAPAAEEQCGAATAEKAEPVLAADRCCAPAEHAEPVSAARRRVAPAKKAEPVAEAEQCIAPAKMAPVQCVTPTKMNQPVAAAAAAVAGTEQCIALAPAETPKPVTAAAELCLTAAKTHQRVAAAGQRRAPATKPRTSRVFFGGPSFVIPPDPSELPIPVLLLKSRGRRSAACA